MYKELQKILSDNSLLLSRDKDRFAGEIAYDIIHGDYATVIKCTCPLGDIYYQLNKETGRLFQIEL